MSTCDSIIIIDADAPSIVVTEDKWSVLNVIDVGATGAQGVAGGSTIVKTAFDNVAGLHAVYVTPDGSVSHASPATVFTSNVIGITKGSALPNDAVLVQPSGEIQDPVWNWVAGTPIYLGLSGNLTQSLPTTGFHVEIGVADSATSIIIRIQPPIYLL
jgi:hypothetical protein